MVVGMLNGLLNYKALQNHLKNVSACKLISKMTIISILLMVNTFLTIKPPDGIKMV